MRSEARRRRHANERPGWTWSHLLVLAAVGFALGAVVWETAHG